MVQAIGNHEFDDGLDVLAAFAANVSFPLLSSNVNYTASRLDGLVAKSAVLDVGEEKVGVVGYTTTETPSISSPGE